MASGTWRIKPGRTSCSELGRVQCAIGHLHPKTSTKECAAATNSKKKQNEQKSKTRIFRPVLWMLHGLGFFTFMGLWCEYSFLFH